MNEKCGSKQTNFEHTWLCNEKFRILNQGNILPVRIGKDKNKIVFRTATKKAPRGNVLDICAGRVQLLLYLILQVVIYNSLITVHQPILHIFMQKKMMTYQASGEFYQNII